jgi:hypothetical protein
LTQKQAFYNQKACFCAIDIMERLKAQIVFIFADHCDKMGCEIDKIAQCLGSKTAQGLAGGAIHVPKGGNSK